MDDINYWQNKFELCPYSCRLINKLALLNESSVHKFKVDISEVQKAIYYAKKYHGKQKRQSGDPYYSHPLEVAYMISSYLFRTDIIITAILHDTLEDTELTFDMIKQEFGASIASQVLDLTRIKIQGNKISTAEIVRKLWDNKKYDILLIKLFDRLHNMESLGVKSADKISKIANESMRIFLSLSIYFEFPELEKQISELCYKNLNISPDLEEDENSF